MSPRKSRRRLAAPFVMTLSLAGLTGGCVVKEAPPPQNQAQQTGETRYDQNGNEILTKPVVQEEPPVREEPLTSEGSGSGSALPPVISNPPPPDPKPLPAAPTDAKGTVVTSADGTCWFQYTIDCPPKATCNPPPPLQVQCEE